MMAGGPYGDGVSVKTSWGKIHRTFLSGLLFLLGGCDRDGVPAAGRDGLSGNVADRVVPQRPGALVPPPADSDAWGSVARGREAFYHYGCWQCHPIGDDEAPGMREGLTMGPDLADVGRRLDREAILQSILEPNAVIAEPREEHLIDGVSLMPSFDDPRAMDDIRAIVAFLGECRLLEEQSQVQPPGKGTPQNLIVLSDSNYEELLGREKGFVLLDFWAEWCFACLETNPVLEEMASELKGRLKICKIEVDENPVLVSRFVPEMMFPCFVVLKGGELVDRKYGVPATVEPRPFFEAWFESVVR